MLAFETKKDHVELPLCEHTHTHSNHLQILNVVDVQSLSCVQLFVTSQTIACQAPLSSTLSWSLLKFIESLMVSHHLILCHSLLRLSSIFSTSGSFPMTQLFTSGGQSIGASASASVLPMNVQGWFPLGLTCLTFLLLFKGLSRVFSISTIWKHQFFGTYPFWGFPDSSVGKQSTCNVPGFDPWVGKMPWRREWLPTPVFWPGEVHGLYNPWGHKELDMTERLSLTLF